MGAKDETLRFNSPAPQAYSKASAQSGRWHMSDRLVKLKLNQQQLELLDRTIAAGAAPDRAALVRRALREASAKRGYEIGGGRK